MGFLDFVPVWVKIRSGVRSNPSKSALPSSRTTYASSVSKWLYFA